MTHLLDHSDLDAPLQIGLERLSATSVLDLTDQRLTAVDLRTSVWTVHLNALCG
jgi:hypothetical protein